jgi:broad specificity phosphatase PhoE
MRQFTLILTHISGFLSTNLPLDPVILEVIYVRHAESVWNDRQSNGATSEDNTDPDVPLSLKGIRQSERLGDWVMSPEETACQTTERVRRIMNSPDDTAIIGVSNLSRAIQTLLLALKGKFLGASDSPHTVHIVSHLQETSAGIDAWSTVDANEAPKIDTGVYEGLSLSPSMVGFNVDANIGHLDHLETPPGMK